MPSEDFYDIARKARELDESCMDLEIERQIRKREESRKSIEQNFIPDQENSEMFESSKEVLF